MGCVSSAFLEEGAEEDGRRRIISHHHIVSLTSSTYGILNSPSCSSASPPPPIGPPPLPTAASLPPPPPPPPPPPTNLIKSGPQQQQQEPEPEPEEVINSWELMAGLLDPSTPGRPPLPPTPSSRRRRIRFPLRPIDGNARPSPAPSAAAVLYTTSLRGVRSTFEACNAVRAALQAHGVAFRERDVSMDRGFREELRDLLLSPSSYACGSGSGSGSTSTTTTKRKVPSLPRLFVRGRHVGGAEEVLRLDEQGLLAPLLEGLPRARGGTYCCDGCGGMRFLPCFDCSGSRKLLLSSSSIPAADNSKQQQQQGWNCSRRRTVVVRCGECNENGLVLCPICS